MKLGQRPKPPRYPGAVSPQLPQALRPARRTARLLVTLVVAASSCALEPWDYEPRGPAHVWSHVYGSAAPDEAGYAIALDADLSVFVSGQMTGAVDFGGGLLRPVADVSHTDVFLVSVDTVGAHRWGLRPLGGWGGALAARSADVCIVGGYGDRAVPMPWSTRESAGDSDVFVACVRRSDGAGSPVRGVGGPGADRGEAVAVDATGNVYVAGTTVGPTTAPFAGESFAGGSASIFSLGADGSERWARSLPSPDAASSDSVHALAVDDAGGRLFVAGAFQQAIDPGGGTEMARGDYDAFVAAYDLQGRPLWQTAFGDVSTDKAVSVAAGAGVVVVAGWYNGSPHWYSLGTVWDVATPPTLPDESGFVAVLDASTGRPLRIAAFNAGWVDAVVLDPASSSLYLTGGCVPSSGTDLGGGVLPTHGGHDVVLASLDLELRHRWSLAFGGPGRDWGFGLAVSGTRICATGMTDGDADFGGPTFAGVGGGDIFVACYDE